MRQWHRGTQAASLSPPLPRRLAPGAGPTPAWCGPVVGRPSRQWGRGRDGWKYLGVLQVYESVGLPTPPQTLSVGTWCPWACLEPFMSCYVALFWAYCQADRLGSAKHYLLPSPICGGRTQDQSGVRAPGSGRDPAGKPVPTMQQPGSWGWLGTPREEVCRPTSLYIA